MKFFFSLWAITFLLYGCASSPPSSEEPMVNKKIDQLVAQLTQDTSLFENKKFAITELTGWSGEKTRLTAFFAEKLVSSLSKTRKIKLVERGSMDSIVKELNLSMSGYIDERSEKMLGKMLGADGLIVGTVTDLGDSFALTVRLIDTETAEIRSVAETELVKDKKLLGLADNVLATPHSNYQPPLTMQMNLIAQRKTESGSYEEIGIRDGAVLRSGDNIQIHFKTNADCYVYVFIFDSQGKASRIFPDTKIALSNSVKANLDLSVPSEDLWFWLDEQTGTETIYLVASYEPMRKIDQLLSEMEQGAGESGKKALSGQIHDGIGSLYRGMAPTQRPKPTRPIEITGMLGHEAAGEARERGLGGIRLGESKKFSLSDGRVVEKVSEIIQGYATVVRSISFEHRN